ncbi:MAG: LysE family translocator, partial [Alphaproteobacteria bacterium]|nr:LysE family translocator [Alphaproteobacteria bacterium]
MTETLIPFLLAVLALLIVPGPDMAFVMANGIAYGRRGAFFSALGISSGGL